MSLGRRKVRAQDSDRWVFNRMVDAYQARPDYPVPLLDALQAYFPPGARVGDIGAGLGHLALPLAARGYRVIAAEPAIDMLTRLGERAALRGLQVERLNAKAEELPLADSSLDGAVVCDAVHFLDAERAAAELLRVLTPGAPLILITCELTRTPFMESLIRIMEDAAPRRPRQVDAALTQLLATTGTKLPRRQVFCDQTPVDPPRLEQILKSISFIGPAMNAERWAAFRERVHAIGHPACWARTFTLLGPEAPASVSWGPGGRSGSPG
jgi:SAM-dependent methyltransferase